MYTNFIRIATAIFFIFSIFSCSTPEEGSIENVNIVQYYEYNEDENELLDLINDYRISVGLNRLDKINHISHVCHEHTEYMIKSNKVGHDHFCERQMHLHDVLGALKVGENIAFNYNTPQSALNAWLKSNYHKENIEGDYTAFGICIDENEQGQKYYTNIFIKI